MTSANKSSPIPTIDLRAFTTSNASQDQQAATSAALVDALHTAGFCYLSHHGVPADALARAFALSRAFFALPDATKRLSPHPPGWAVHRGYSWPGLEKVSNALAGERERLRAAAPQDVKESFEIGSPANADMPNVWPPPPVLALLAAETGVPWRESLLQLYRTLDRAARAVLRALAMGLGVEEEEILGKVSGEYNQLRLLRYPPVEAAEVESGRLVRMEGHSDWSVITMLFQDEVGGLQVERPDGEGFVDVEPVEGTLVLNVGDLLMRWSNDYLKSTQHRVTLPSLQDRFTGDDKLTRERYSIPYFVTTNPDVMIQPLQCKDAGLAKYEPITQREYAAMRARMQY